MPEENKRISLIKFIWSQPEGQRLATAALLAIMFLVAWKIADSVVYARDIKALRIEIRNCNDSSIAREAKLNDKFWNFVTGARESDAIVKNSLDSISVNSKKMKRIILRLKNKK